MTETFEFISTRDGGQFDLYYNTEKAGEITFQWDGERRMAIDHTEVFEGFNGKGIGKKLVQHCVHYAREKGYQIKTICPFAAKVFDVEETYNDLRYY